MKEPRMTKKLLMLIDYCQDQYVSSNGEILSDMTAMDFVDLRAMVKALFKD